MKYLPDTKREVVLRYPELNRRKEIYTEADHNKDLEYEKLCLRLEQQRLVTENSVIGLDNSAQVEKEVKTLLELEEYPIKVDPLLFQEIKFEDLSKLPRSFIASHIGQKREAYKKNFTIKMSVPIYFVVNDQNFSDCTNHNIFGFLIGLYRYQGQVYARISQDINKNILTWIKRTHKHIRLHVDRSGKMYLSGKRIWDKTIGQYVNPLNGYSYSEIECYKLEAFLKKQESTKNQIDRLIDKRDSLSDKNEIEKISRKIQTLINELSFITQDISKFAEQHLEESEDEYWTDFFDIYLAK